MMRVTLLLTLSVSVLLSAWSPVAAQTLDPDEEGCKDSPLLTRMPGCRLHSCDVKEFDGQDLVIGHLEADSRIKTLEGAVERLEYHCPKKYSFLQLARNAESALKKAGYGVVYSGKNYDSDDNPVITANKGPQWVSVETRYFNELPAYTLLTVLVKGVEQQMAASAQAMADAIAASGRLDVYGITFATGQATISPESDKVLADVLAVLTANPEWKLRVEGHTDNVGQAAANQKLSEARAAAVVAWLVKNGVDASRLTSAGLGDTQPVDANTSDAGRAKNRRVVLIKQ